jgi:pterin-4a-carbinolamine dehydratase
MYVGRTPEINVMTDFEDFYHDLLEFTKKYEQKNIPLKIEKDLENDVIKIFGEKITSLARAKNGLNDVTELAYTTAEHHPYWNLVYNCSEITNSVLEKWKESLSEDDFSDIEWAIKELNQTLEKIKKKNPSNS